MLRRALLHGLELGRLVPDGGQPLLQRGVGVGVSSFHFERGSQVRLHLGMIELMLAAESLQIRVGPGRGCRLAVGARNQPLPIVLIDQSGADVGIHQRAGNRAAGSQLGRNGVRFVLVGARQRKAVGVEVRRVPVKELSQQPGSESRRLVERIHDPVPAHPHPVDPAVEPAVISG